MAEADRPADRRAVHEAAERRSTHEAAERRSTHEAAERRSTHEAAERRSIHEAAERRSIHEAAERRSIHEAAERRSIHEAAERRSIHEAAADRLLEAARLKRPCAPVRELLPDGDLDDGYEVQSIVHARGPEGRRRVGRKVGLTSVAVQQQMGVDTPDFGVLFADMAYGDAQPIPFGELLQPRVEAEVAFVMGADLPEHEVTPVEVLRAVDFVVPSIEVVDSRIAGWDISIFDTVADNASSGVFVTGGSPSSLRAIDDLGACEMALVADGEVVSSGTGAACLGHPLNAVVWLANVVAQRGDPLQAGELVLSGSLGPLVPVRAGGVYEATITGLGSVRAAFTPA